jgi:hypothetical protein
MKVKIKAHVYYNKYSWESNGIFQIYSFKMDDENHRTHVCEQEVEVEVPDNYDPRAQQITALEKQKQKVMADYQKTVNEINTRISKLQALEHTA